ncbi:MAG: hypothetical protein EKK47_20395 [Burkholderiales bacterium]|nr:MAG: hypothetical protein EKK47_20395 [Burkholderiales bacterium]
MKRDKGQLRMKHWLCYIALLCLSQSGFACKFLDLGLEESLKRAQVAFIAISESPSNGMSGKGPAIPAMMRPVQVIKGTVTVGALVPVFTANSSCGLGIQKGQQWLILASGQPLTSDQPSGSLLLQDQSTRSVVSGRLGLKLD